ncbi:hypothetical protein DM02DRAFT_619040 [Periconia macrospinosa]|uniref:Uncharacterized protein n=1 Tax=Periconia macrospinosa TaxID=97972 RepID=A0A2V1D9H9_9PLEO|nr:hypothetical protein DM02DRAFT_619040 [Periconia macrospinosa]
MPPSIIERLPAELIQPIFRESGYNPSLPLASPHIAAKLSDKRVYTAVCDHLLTAQHVNARPHQKASQTLLFAAKWMTWDFFKSWVLHQYEPKGCLCGKTEKEGCWDKQWPINWEDASQMPFSRAHLPALAWVNGRLPKKLFTGEWTQDKIEFSRFLLWTTSMTVDWANEEMRQIVLQSRKGAILQGNLEAVELFNHNRRLGKAPDIASIHFAVLEAGCNRSIVFDMLATAHRWGKCEGWARDELDDWCEARIEAGDPKGRWLQQKIQGLRGEVTPARPKPEKEPSPTKWGGNIDQREGDYELEGDKLVVNELRWNEVCVDLNSFSPMLFESFCKFRTPVLHFP